ncbi:uncharacterized protein ACWYII_033365 isoform 3-T11 [Salvelinus alpinus]
MALDECITEKELGRVWKKTSGRHNDQCITSNLKVTESEEDLTLVSKQEMQLQLTTANFQIRELKRENAALRQSLSVIEENRYRNTHQTRTKQRGNGQRQTEEWTWEDVLNGKGCSDLTMTSWLVDPHPSSNPQKQHSKT